VTGSENDTIATPMTAPVVWLFDVDGTLIATDGAASRTPYVFIPLGGSRVARLRNYSNLIVTMFISGVWHGAGTNFIVWGLWHGMLLTGNRSWRDVRGAHQPSTTGRVIGWALTFTSVNLGWAFFCMDLPTARFFFYRLFIG
jgi:alginate O-acetyltransferase complex protein AlgI